VAKPQVIGENDEPVEPEPGEDLDNFWQTSVGKFKFCVDDLPQPLQYIHQLLQELPKVDKPDILYYMLQCLNILILHGDACTKASKEHRGFFIWCQENLLIKKYGTDWARNGTNSWFAVCGSCAIRNIPTFAKKLFRCCCTQSPFQRGPTCSGV
jgi:hypothetical protein